MKLDRILEKEFNFVPMVQITEEQIQEINEKKCNVYSMDFKEPVRKGFLSEEPDSVVAIDENHIRKFIELYAKNRWATKKFKWIPRNIPEGSSNEARHGVEHLYMPEENEGKPGEEIPYENNILLSYYCETEVCDEEKDYSFKELKLFNAIDWYKMEFLSYKNNNGGD